MRANNIAAPPAATVSTPEQIDADALGYREFVMAKIQAGIESAALGPCLTVDEARAHFAARAQARSQRSAR